MTNDLELQHTFGNRRNRFQPVLESMSETDLFTAVEQFYEAKKLGGVVSLRLLKRGALLGSESSRLVPEPHDALPRASNRLSHANIGVLLPDEDKFLTQDEEAALRREAKGGINSLSKGLVVTLATCAIGAVVQGWSQQSITGANLEWPVELGLAKYTADGGLDFDEKNGSVYFGLVNAIPYFAASLVGAWVSDPLTDRFGRRTALFFAGVCSFVAPIGGAYSRNWHELLGFRIIQGVGMGAKSSVVPIMESEVSPLKMRGRLLVLWQTFVAIGIFLGAGASCIFAGHWRLQFGIAFVPALPLLCLCYVIQESPRWLIKKGEYREAYLAMRDIRQTPLQAARDLFLIHAQLKLESALFLDSTIMEVDYERIILQPESLTDNFPNPGFFKRVGQLVTIRRNWRAVVSSGIVMAAQQFSGINIYAFLATTIFGASDIDNTKALWFTLGFGASNAIFSALTYFMINRFGRRTLIIWSLVLMFPLLLLTGHYLDIRENGTPPLHTVIALVIIHSAVYSPGAGVIPFMYASEVFPLVHREAGMSLAVSVNLALAGALTIGVPQYVQADNNMKLLGTFAGLDIIAAIAVWLFMRSPQEARSLEDMNYLFLRQPMFYYARYQLFVVLPWALRNPLRLFGFKRSGLCEFDVWFDTLRRKAGD